MTTEEILRLVFSFLGGGLIVTIVDWIRSARTERAARAVDHLSEQLQSLYGPLFYFSSQNESISRISNKIHGAYTVEYCNKKWADSAAESIDKEAKDTIDLNNRYTSMMLENNEKMVEILNRNYGLIDAEDVQPFQEFVMNSFRYKIESENKPPFRIQQHLDSIAFYRSDFAERLKVRFLTKTRQLSRLRQLSKSWFGGFAAETIEKVLASHTCENAGSNMTDKEKGELLTKLLDSQLNHFSKTRDHEWKVNIGLWTAIVLGGGFLYSQGVRLDPERSIWLYAGILTWFAHLFLWMVPIQYSEDTDDFFINHYRQEVEKLCDFPHKDRPLGWFYRAYKYLRRGGISWLLAETWITAFLLIVVWAVLCYGPPPVIQGGR